MPILYYQRSLHLSLEALSQARIQNRSFWRQLESCQQRLLMLFNFAFKTSKSRETDWSNLVHQKQSWFVTDQLKNIAYAYLKLTRAQVLDRALLKPHFKYGESPSITSWKSWFTTVSCLLLSGILKVCSPL